MSFMPTNEGGSFPGVFATPFLPAMMIAFSSGLKAVGIIGQGSAAVEAAKRRQQAADFEAQQLEINAGQAQAAAQRQAYLKGMEGEQLISAIRARSGAGGADPTVLNVIAQAMSKQAYNVQASLYQGQEQSRLMKMQAQGKRYDAALGLEDARATRRGAAVSAIGALAEGGTSLYQKYWAKDPELGMTGQITPGRGYDNEFTP